MEDTRTFVNLVIMWVQCEHFKSDTRKATAVLSRFAASLVMAPVKDPFDQGKAEVAFFEVSILLSSDFR